MIIGILGNLGDQEIATTGTKASDCGCGKTLLNAYLGYSEFLQKDRKVIANFHTRFAGMPWGTPSWAEYRTSQEIFDMWMEVDEDHPDYGAMVLLTEVSALINSAQRDTKVIAYIERCLNQRRKNKWDIIWDSQTLGSADKRWRSKTDYIYKPVKYHCVWSPEYKEYVWTDPCPLDNCDERHIVVVYIEQSPHPLTLMDLKTPRLFLKAWEVGQLYDTNEKMKDTIKFNPRWFSQE